MNSRRKNTRRSAQPKPGGYSARRSGLPVRLGVSGRMHLEVVNPDGSVAATRTNNNLALNDGLDWLVELVLDSVTPTTLSTLTDIAIGSDATAVGPTDTGLGTEVARQVFDSYTKSVGVGVASVETTFLAGTGPATIAEAGLYDAGAGGNILNRVVFTPVVIDATQTIRITFTLTFTAA